MNNEDEEILQATIVKVEGRPNLPERPKERTRWEAFKFFLFPHLKKSKELAEAYAEAKVEKEKSEARKIAEEAAEIAARRDLTKQQEASEFNAVIDDIFADDGLPPGAKALKLAKLMEKNQQVSAQIDKFNEIVQELGLKKGLNIDVEEESLKFLPEEKDLNKGQEEVPEEEKIDEELAEKLNMPVQELDLSARVMYCFESIKLETVGQLVKMRDTDLLKIVDFGKASLREVKKELSKMGLSLAANGKSKVEKGNLGDGGR